MILATASAVPALAIPLARGARAEAVRPKPRVEVRSATSHDRSPPLAGQFRSDNLLRFGLYAVTQAMQFAIFAVIVVLIIRTQHLPAAADLHRLQSALWQTVAMAIGFAVSIPLYLLIGQRAFALWALAPLVINLILRPRLRRRHTGAT